MAGYYEKYRKEITQDGGATFRLSIHEYRASALPSGYPYEIGGFAACNLILQGQQSDVFAPVVKTSLEIVLVDVADEPLVSLGSGKKMKQGGWEEFFTPDATKYKVILSKKSGNSYPAIWTGYITPDSYEEQLVYHGTISVISRDNLGHLGDLDFDGVEDESGMVSVGSIVTQALAKVGAMGLKNLDSDFNSGNHILCQDAGRTTTAVNIKGLYVNITACRGKKWLEVLENVLDSVGLTLRYSFDNTFILAEMGMIPEYLDGTRAGGAVRTFKMINSSGSRRFVAAARMIEETFNAEYGGLMEVDTDNADYQDATVTMGGVSQAVHEPTGNHPFRRTGAIGMINPLSGHYYNPRVGSIFYSGQDMFITAVKSSDAVSGYGTIKAEIPIAVGGENMTLRFRLFVGAYSHDGDYISGGAIFSTQSGRVRRPTGTYQQTMAARYMIAYDNGTTTLYLNDSGYFQDTQFVLSDSVTSGYRTTTGRYGAESVEVEKAICLPNSEGTLKVIFQPFLLTNNAAPSISTGNYFGRIYGLEITQDDESWKGYDLKTNYDDKNNIVLGRDPGFGQVSEITNPHVLKNGLYVKGTGGKFPAAGVFYWRAKDTDNLMLAALIHQQMLQYYSRPEKQLCADIIDAVDGLLSFNSIYRYRDEKYIIQSGSFDIINNVLTGVVMRTWRKWAEMWGDEPVQNYLTVTPSAINLTDVTLAEVTVNCNTSWRVKTLPAGLSVSSNSGTGSRIINVGRDSTFQGGTLVFETADHALTASVSVVREVGIVPTIVSVGEDVTAMEFPNISGIYYVEINWDTAADDFLWLYECPSWIHFDDTDVEGGIIYYPGVYGIYCDDLPSSAPRDGNIVIQGVNTSDEARLYVKQIG